MKTTTLLTLATATALGIVSVSIPAHGTLIFQDTFDRANSSNPSIDASLDGITDNTGSSLTANNVYQQPHTVGGSFISGNELELADGSGTANAYVDHNFLNSDFLSDLGMVVSVDLTGVQNGGAGAGNGGAFAIGMSSTEAGNAGDALFNNAFTSAFGSNTAASDFYVGLRADSTIAWGGVGLTEQSASVGSNTGTISARFLFGDFNAGSTVNYLVSYNGMDQGSGSFQWSESNSNYIGLDARDGAGVTFDNLLIETAVIPEPSSLALLIAGSVLMVYRRRKA